MLHSSTADPFKLALYKLIGKLEPSRRSVAHVTTTTEDWLWFQLSMVSEEEDGGLRALSDVLLSYGERHFDGAPGQPGARRGMWAGVLLMCGQFERAVAALWDHPETEIEAVHLAIALAYHGLLRIPSRAETSDVTPLSLSPASPPALSLSTLIWRYVRQFVKMDAKEALQYVYSVCLSADQGNGVGQEQVEIAWELVRRIIVLANTGPAWEELVGGIRPEGGRFVSLHWNLLPFANMLSSLVSSSKAHLFSSSQRPPSSVPKSLFALRNILKKTIAFPKQSSSTILQRTTPLSSHASLPLSEIPLPNLALMTRRGASKRRPAKSLGITNEPIAPSAKIVMQLLSFSGSERRWMQRMLDDLRLRSM